MTVYDVAAQLPDVPILRDLCRAMVMADAILEPPAAFRPHRYDAHWLPGVALAAMSNGAGDGCTIVFTPAGAFMYGLDHHSPMSSYAEGEMWPGVVDSVPTAFTEYVTEPKLSIDGDGLLPASFCLWRELADTRWRAGTIQFPEKDPNATVGDVEDDGAEFATHLLMLSPEDYQDWAEDYYKTAIDAAALRRVFALEPMTEELVASLNPGKSVAGLAKDIDRIGYPRQATPT